MVHYVHQLPKQVLKHVIQWAAVAKQQLAVEVGVAGVAALRAVAEELTKGQEHALRNLLMMVLNARHIKIQTLEAVIQWAAVLKQQQAAGHMEVVVKSVEAELRREHVQENQQGHLRGFKRFDSESICTGTRPTCKTNSTIQECAI